MGIKKCDALICSGSTAAGDLQEQDALIPEGWFVFSFLLLLSSFINLGEIFKTHTKELVVTHNAKISSVSKGSDFGLITSP